MELCISILSRSKKLVKVVLLVTAINIEEKEQEIESDHYPF